MRIYDDGSDDLFGPIPDREVPRPRRCLDCANLRPKWYVRGGVLLYVGFGEITQMQIIAGRLLYVTRKQYVGSTLAEADAQMPKAANGHYLACRYGAERTEFDQTLLQMGSLFELRPPRADKGGDAPWPFSLYERPKYDRLLVDQKKYGIKYPIFPYGIKQWVAETSFWDLFWIFLLSVIAEPYKLTLLRRTITELNRDRKPGPLRRTMQCLCGLVAAEYRRLFSRSSR